MDLFASLDVLKEEVLFVVDSHPVEHLVLWHHLFLCRHELLHYNLLLHLRVALFQEVLYPIFIKDS